MTNPVWVREDVVRAIHRRQIAEHGGAEGVRDQGLPASTLARPRNRLAYSKKRPDLAALAAAYAFGIAKNHPFVDGNRRVPLIVCRLFLRLNGRDLEATPQEKYPTFLGLAEGRISEKKLTIWIRKHLAR